MTDPNILLERIELLNKLNRNITSFNNHQYDDLINYNNDLIYSTLKELRDLGVIVVDTYMG